MSDRGIRHPNYDVRALGLGDGREVVLVEAGPRGVERVVPPAGDDHAFERKLWARRVEIYTSRTGRSARVWVDGIEIVPAHNDGADASNGAA